MTATSQNQLPGGSAAQTPNPNPADIMPAHIKIETPEKTVQVRLAAMHFNCAASSLKNNIKHGKLPAWREDATAPYMVRLSDVERFLRDTPGIKSMFHPNPKASDDTKDGPLLTGFAPVATSPSQAAEHPVNAEAATSVKPDPVRHSGPETEPQIGAPPESGRKRRRPRRRGKGGAGNGLASAGLQPLMLKALTGTTPKERLCITACLIELAGLVATA